MKEKGFKGFVTSKFGKFVITLLCMIVIYGIIFLCMEINPVIAAIIGFACTIFGWKTLGETPLFIDLFASASFLLFWYIIKFMLAVLIGLFVAPFRISKAITKYVASHGNK